LALAAAVGLGLVFPTGTRSAVHSVGLSADHGAQHPETEAEHVAAVDERATEIDVELAWLADPATFPYHLGARLEGNALHARGFVQSKAAHDRALQLAREHCPLEVIDQLQIYPSMVIPVMSPLPAPIPSEAEAALQEALPSQPGSFRVTCLPSGQVTVTGTIPSLEGKLAASQRLRQLPGCTAVVNQLYVGPAPTTASAPRPDPGQAHKMPSGPTLVEEAGPTWVPASHWQPVNSVPPLPDSPSPVSGPLVPTAPAQTTTKPDLVPNAPLLARLKARMESVCASGATDVHLVPLTGRSLLVQFKVRDDAEAARLAEKILTMPELANYHLDLDVKVAEPPTSPVPPGWRSPVTRTGPSAVPAPPATTNTANNPLPASPPPPVPEIRKAEAAPAVTPYMPSQGVPTITKTDLFSSLSNQPVDGIVYVMPEYQKPKPQPAVTPAAPPPAKLQEEVESVCGSNAKNLHLVVRSPNKVSIGFTAPSEAEGERLALLVMNMPQLSAYHVDLDVKVAGAAAKANDGSYLTTGNIQLTTAAPASPVVASTKAARQPSENPGQSGVYETTGVIVIAEPAPTPPAQAPMVAPALLQERVASTCGSRAEARVLVRSATNVLVQLKAQDAAEAERLTAALLRLPELGPYQVDVDVKLAQ